MKVLFQIIHFEWKRWLYEQSTLYVTIGLLLLTFLSIYAGTERYREQADLHAMATKMSQNQWDEQPDRHPHRVSHFGDFVFKPVHPLSSFDPGGNAFTGNLLFLESHRQNSANFNEASENSALIRFGQLSPAFVLQVMTPLLLIFLGFSSIAAERESGTAMHLMASGLHPGQWILGKLLALALPGLIITLIVALAAIVILPFESDTLYRVTVLFAGYSLYVLLWSCIIVAISSATRHSHSALIFLIALWLALCIAGPRVSYAIAEQRYPLPSLVEMDFAAEDALKTIGDSHNPNDPHFNAFRQRVLDQYGVSSVEELPVNYNGLLMTEGERLTTQLYREKHNELAARMRGQQGWVSALAWLNPTLALQGLSRALSASDLTHHLDFLERAEVRRYAVTQYLNKLHTHEVAHQGDKEQRLDAGLWKSAPRDIIDLPSHLLGVPAALSGMLKLGLWLGLALIILYWRIRRMETGV